MLGPEDQLVDWFSGTPGRSSRRGRGRGGSGEGTGKLGWRVGERAGKAAYLGQTSFPPLPSHSLSILGISSPPLVNIS